MKKLLIIVSLAITLSGCLVFGHGRGHDEWRDDQHRGQQDQRDDQRHDMH